MKSLFILLSSFLSLSASAYDTLHYFSPERFCLAEEPRRRNLICDSDTTFRGLDMAGYAACDLRIRARRLADGREFLILFTGDGEYHRMGPGVMTLNTAGMMISLSMTAAQAGAVKAAHRQILAKTSLYVRCP